MITQAYFYCSAIRPGIITRTFIADPECVFRDSYWTTSPAYNAFGNQFNASKYGDLPQDIYRFMGGGVFRHLAENKVEYGIYSSMAIVIPKGSHANRVVAPFAEPLLEVNGRQFYIFEAGAPSPGVIYEIGEPIGIGGMSFPAIGNINCTKKVIFPDRRKVISSGVTNKIGILKMVPNMIVADVPGVYKIQEACWHDDKKGDVIGTADGTYNIYVDDKDRRKYFRIQNLKNFIIQPKQGLNVRAQISDKVENPQITYSIIMPGCVMDEGTLPVTKGEFSYKFLPEEFNVQFPNYDFFDFKYVPTESYVRLPLIDEFDPQKARIVDLVMMTFFLEGKDEKTGRNIYDVSTVMLRGERAYVIEYE